MTTALTVDRKAEFEEVNSRIFESINAASVDLRHMRESRLYIAGGCAKWDDYCRDYLGCSTASANRIINHESLVENIAEVAPANLRLTHSAAAEIADLKPEQQREVAKRLPAEKSKPSPRETKAAREAVGIPPKPRKEKPTPPVPLSKGGIVRSLFEQREEAARSPRMPQDASASKATTESNGHAEVEPEARSSDPDTGLWLQSFDELMMRFSSLFSRNAAQSLPENHRLSVAQGLRKMADCIPSSINWTGEEGPTPGGLKAAVLLIQRITAAASEWGDSAAVAKLADELRKCADSLEPEKDDSDAKAIESTEEMQKIVAAWNAAGQIQCRVLSAERRKKLRTRLKDKFWRDNVFKAIEVAERIPAIMENGCDFDWFLQSDKVVRLIEGKYDGWKSGREPSRKLEADYGKGGRIR